MLAGADKSLFLTPISDAAAPNPSTIRSFYLDGPAGRLEALLNEGQANAPYATVLCHPHPLGGGTMHNKVVYHAMKAFHAFGWPVLRFNFRGTGLSEGKHHGSQEYEDVLTALDWLAQQYNKPIVAAGFSFGAAMGLKAVSELSSNSQIKGFAALGLPTHASGRDYTYPHLASLRMPKLFLSGDHDQFAPIAQLESVVAAAAFPKEMVFGPAADHFFTGHLAAMQTQLRCWLQQTFLTGQEQNPLSPEKQAP
jgi:alpha/beta superfamily hydrolase